MYVKRKFKYALYLMLFFRRVSNEAYRRGLVGDNIALTPALQNGEGDSVSAEPEIQLPILGDCIVKKERKPSAETLLVLAEFLREATLHGYEIIKRTGLGPSTLYVIIARLKERGYIEAEKDGFQESEEGRPRKVYKLTDSGRAYAISSLSENYVNNFKNATELIAQEQH